MQTSRSSTDDSNSWVPATHGNWNWISNFEICLGSGQYWHLRIGDFSHPPPPSLKLNKQASKHSDWSTLCLCLETTVPSKQETGIWFWFRFRIWSCVLDARCKKLPRVGAYKYILGSWWVEGLSSHGSHSLLPQVTSKSTSGNLQREGQCLCQSHT